MRRILFLMLAVVLLAGLSGLSGCCCNRPAACEGNCLIDGSCGTCADCPETCQAAAPDGAFGQGTGGVVAYPYYTTRGPRDFLAKNPRNIGP